MQIFRINHIMKFNKRMRIGLASLLSAWVLLLSLATVSPDLHSWLHHSDTDTCKGHCHSEHSESDSEDPFQTDHVCAVTLFAAGLDFHVPFSLPEATFPPVGTIVDTDKGTSCIGLQSMLRARAPPAV